MAETLANGTTIPQGSDPIHGSGVQAMRNLGGSVDGQLGNRYTKAQADALLAGKSPVGHTHSWAQVTGKPSAFPPATHTHDARYYTQTQIDTRLDAISTAYQVAQMFGFEGTAEQWLASLVGPRGPEGPYGGTAVTDPQVASYVTSETETRTALDKGYRRGVSVLEYGATGDGATNDSAAFQAALATGRSVYVPAGTYIVSGVTTSQPVDLELARGAILNHREAGACITVAGAEAKVDLALAADASPGAVSLNIPGHGLSEGQWIRLSSSLLWDASSTSIRHGELLRVASIDNDVITVTTPIQGGPYTVAEAASIRRLDLVPKVSIRGSGKILGARVPNRVQTGILVRLARNVVVTDIDMADLDYRHIAFEDVVDGSISGVDHEWAQDNGMAYAVAICNASQDVEVRDNTFVDVRHAFTTSNLASVPGIVRRVAVIGNTVRRSLTALVNGAGGDAMDTHTAADDITFERNVIIGASGHGINIECPRARTRWNTIISPAQTGVMYHNESDQDGAFESIGDRVVSPGLYGIRVSPPTRGSTATVRGVRIASATVEGAVQTPIYVGSTGGALVHAVTVQGTTGLRCTATALVRVSNASSVVHTGSNASGGTATAVIDDQLSGGVDPGYLIRTVASGAVAVTPTTRYLRLGTTTNDSLKAITGGATGQVILACLSSSAGVLLLENGVSGGNIRLASALTLTGVNDSVLLRYDGARWTEVSRTKF